MSQHSQKPGFDPAERRPAAVRTALVIGGVALAIYLAFILSGVIGR